MYNIKRGSIIIIGFLFFAFYSCKKNETLVDKLKSGELNEFVIEGKPSLRGVNVLNDDVAWVCGSKGYFARTLDGGINWIEGRVNPDTLLDFRDIHVFSNESAIVASAGSPARFYKTFDGGKTWKLVYENLDSTIFINSIDFYDSLNGYAWSDPINSKFFILNTKNSGESWDTLNITRLPIPLQHEAGFAASGTSIISNSNGLIMFVTGGAKARVIRSADFGETWEAIETPIKVDSSSYGIYSIATMNNNSFIVAGGSWQNPDERIDNVATTNDNGLSWTPTKTFPSGFRSAVLYLYSDQTIVTCGTNGVDLSVDLGNSWQKIPISGFNAIGISESENFLVFAGSSGRIAYIRLNI